MYFLLIFSSINYSNPEIIYIDRPRMAITNFIVTVLGVGAVVLLLRSDVKQSANVFKRNMRQIRTWLEEESSAVSKGEHAKPKEIDPHVPEKNVPKEDKH